MADVIGANIVNERDTLQNLTDGEFAFVIDVNYRDVFNYLRAQLSAIQTDTTGRGGDSIINASSIAGLIDIEKNESYIASKHAVTDLTRTATKEEGGKTIRVNAVAPEIISTPMMKQIEASASTTELFKRKEPGALARRGDPEEVASVITFLLSDDSSFISGQVISIDRGLVC